MKLPILVWDHRRHQAPAKDLLLGPTKGLFSQSIPAHNKAGLIDHDRGRESQTQHLFQLRHRLLELLCVPGSTRDGYCRHIVAGWEEFAPLVLTLDSR